MDAPVPMFYEGKKVKTILCHKLVAPSLSTALEEAYKLKPEFVSDYFGCYNFRKMRGGTKYSLHARGAAIDLSATKNGNKTSWPVGSTMPIEVIECFAKQGWVSAGVFWGRDAMHFQATAI
jgi:D-alanyl-D-alanine carboxypeptidase